MIRLLALALLTTAATAQTFEEIVPPDAEVQVLANGFGWAEGPVWRVLEGDLLFSDVPGNTIWRWTDEHGLEVYLRPAGRALGTDTPGETGSNGLILDHNRRLLIAEHGSRSVTRLDAETWVRQPLATHYDGRRLNSPNDLALHRSGVLFFTDPPYGLAGGDDSPQKEQPHNGVYRLDPDGTVTLLIDDLTRPNGVILSPDEQTLYVANSDPERAIWRAYPVLEGGALGEGRLLFDATSMVDPETPGLPDGMAMGADGTLFATGPGGVLVLTPGGEHLGTIPTPMQTANVTFGDDGHVLYLTSHDRLQRIRIAARGVGF
ncbi:SMP-30/gluconolactonase/LRE family protein [Rubrivirga sp.]|uniref:SMP-30/gluconolactonase/LRE family protein n=1 Tax=Rubrivirga sp. TaxID=1885344 RepID=UPI003C761D3A